MESTNIKRGRGRPVIYTDEERKKATTKSKTKYMLNKEWYCQTCNNNKNYTLAGKWKHIKSIKHQLNSKDQLN